MDNWQHAFEYVLGIAMAGLAWIIKGHDKDLKEMPDRYARRDDIKEIKEVLVRIEDKLDKKADRSVQAHSQ